MSGISLTSGADFLRDAARQHFELLYSNPKMHLSKQLHKDLLWTPSLRFVIYEHINVFVEPSESGPYPRILELKAREVRNFQSPIEIYAVCPKEALLSTSQAHDVERLRGDGFGLLSVDSDGVVSQVFSTIPLIQIIPDSEIKKEFGALTKRMRQRVSEAFQDYCNKPVNGVRTLTEVVEGMVTRAGKDAKTKGYLSRSDISGGVAKTLDALYEEPNFQSARAQIGGVRGYIAVYRNLTHHWPKNSKKAYQKYADCRHAFLDGVRHLGRFRQAMRAIGLSGNLP